MIIECEQKELMRGINIAIKAIPPRTTMSILECIVLDASGDVIRLLSNDLNMAIDTVIDGTIVEPGTVALDARILSDVIRKLPDNLVKINVFENYATQITCERAKFNLMGRVTDDFSYLPKYSKEQYFDLSEFALHDMIRQTIAFLAEGDIHPVMTGECFHLQDGTLRVVALDGHRIAIREQQVDACSGDMEIIIPGKTLNEIVRILGDDAERMVRVYIDDNSVFFEFERTKVMSRLVDGKFVNIAYILESQTETKVVLGKREFYDCIDRASMMIKEGDKKPIIFDITDEGIEISIQGMLGSMDDFIEVDEKEGMDQKIGFNPKFLMDALRVVDDEKITAYFINHRSPVYIRADDLSYQYIILPVNFVS